MTIEETLKIYNSLTSAIFLKENRKWKVQNEAFKTTIFKNKMKELITERGLREFIVDIFNKSSISKTFIYIILIKNLIYL